MIYTIDELKQKIKPIAAKYNLPAVYVFGSYARGEATEESDIDILVDKSGSKIKSLFELGGLYDELNKLFKKKVDLITVCALKKEERVIKHLPTFEESVQKERVSIYE